MPRGLLAAIPLSFLALLAVAGGFLPFALGAWLWEFAFTCGCVVQTAGIARRDPSGRAIVLVPAAFALSAMAGPALAGQMVAGGGFMSLLGMALLSSVIPLAAALVGGGRRRRRKAALGAGID